MGAPATRSWSLPLFIFVQMLPVTLLIPTVRPLFAERGDSESVMHAFMSLNMLGAAIAAPLVGRFIDAGNLRRRAIFVLALADALLILSFSASLPAPLLLVFRFLEGAAHISVLTMLMAEAAARAREQNRPKLVGLAGAAIMGAVAFGSAIGAAILSFGPGAVLLTGGLLSLSIALLAPSQMGEHIPAPRSKFSELFQAGRDLWVSVGAAFVARFAIGCLVVTFALYAHHEHNLSDQEIGVLFSAMTITCFLATYPAARLSDRWSPACVLTLGAGLYAVSLALLVFVGAGQLFALMVAGGLGCAGIFSAALAHAAQRSSAQRGMVMALFNGAGCIGMLLGPPIAGITAAFGKTADDPNRGYEAALLVAAISVAIWFFVSLIHLGARAPHGNSRDANTIPSGSA
jgi:MFS family permease